MHGVRQEHTCYVPTLCWALFQILRRQMNRDKKDSVFMELTFLEHGKTLNKIKCIVYCMLVHSLEIKIKVGEGIEST